jgi:glutamyl-tRNA reductase
MREVLAQLPGFTACCWVTALLDRPSIAEARAHALAHGPDAAVVTTCQRLEVYHFGDCDCPAPARLRGVDALMHLAAVATGVHSIVLGETQVLGQVREGLAAASDDVRRMGDLAIAAARDVRREEAFASHAGHLLDRGLHLHPMAGRERALVLGSGPMGRLVARRALEHGFAEVLVASRAGIPLEEPGLTGIRLDEVATLGPVDIAIGCLGSEAPEIDVTAGLPEVRELVLDLGTPRNFCGQSGVTTLGIAELMAGATPHRDAARTRLLARLRDALEHRLEFASEDCTSTVGALRFEVERQRQEEVARILRKNPELPAETVEAITRALVNRIFHAPSERLRELDDAELGQQGVALLRPRDEARAGR